MNMRNGCEEKKGKKRINLNETLKFEWNFLYYVISIYDSILNLKGSLI